MTTRDVIEIAYVAGQQAWPTLKLSKDRFALLVQEVAASDDGLRDFAADFFLACAAADGDETAVGLIEERIIGRLSRPIGRVGLTAAMVPDVLQLVRARLFSGPAPRIRAYNAAAPLAQWIKVVATRTAIDARRHQSSTLDTERAWSAVATDLGSDVATSLMKREHKQEVEATIRELLKKLSPRDRTVLRLHVLEGMSIEKVATAYGVHRVTVARWIWNAGEFVLDGLRAHFKGSLGIASGEFDSLARLMRSQLSLEVTRLLQDERQQ